VGRFRRLLVVFLSAISMTFAIPAASALASTSSTGAIKHGGTLNVLDIGGEYRSLSSLQKSGLGNFLKYSAVYQNLFTFNSAGQLIPQLALSYQYSSNNTVITVQLRRGVHFQDGTLMSAQAVAFDINEWANPAVNSECAPYLTNLTSAVASGANTVVITFRVPYGAFMRIVSGTICGAVVSPTAVQTEGLTGFGTHPVGTGPYAFASEVLGTSSTWTKWSGYWDKRNAGYYNTITVSAIDNDQSCLAAVESGTAQVCANGDPTDYLSVRHNPRVHTIVGPAVAVEDISFNQQQAPFNNLLARRAVAEAIDTAAISKSLYRGVVPATQSILAPSEFGFPGLKVKGYPKYSIANARADVAQLPGHTLSFTLVCQTVPGEITLAEALQSQLASAGITMTINPEDIVTILSQIRQNQYQASQLGTTGYPDPDVVYYRNYNSASSNDNTATNDPIINQYSLKGRETVSGPQRLALYNKVTAEVAKDLPSVPLFPQPLYYFVSPKLRGFNPVGSEIIQWQDVYSA